MEGSETHNHSKDVRPRRDASKQCLNKMHRRENAHKPVFFLKNFDNTQSQCPPPSYMPMAPLPGKKNHAPPPPPSMAPLSGKENLGSGHLQGGGGWEQVPHRLHTLHTLHFTSFLNS